MRTSTALVVAMALAGCGSSGSSKDPRQDPGQGPGAATGSCTATAVATGSELGTIPVAVVCTNYTSSGTWVLGLIDTRDINVRPTGGGSFDFGPSAPASGRTYTLADAYLEQGEGHSGFWFATAEGTWTAGMTAGRWDPTRGSTEVRVTSYANGTAHGDVTAALTPDPDGVGTVLRLHCTF